MRQNKLSGYKKRILICFLTCYLLVSCQEKILTDISEDLPLTTRTVPTLSFDWENASFMPVPAGQSPINTPWSGQGSIVSQYGNDIVNDRKAADGWELMYNTFDGKASGQLVNPYFILYNKYRGIMRVYFYLTTQFVATSSYLQDGISIVSNQESSMLNFVGQDIVDASVKQKQYSQMQPATAGGSLPLASNKWYMLQYEMAYDPNIASIPYNNIQLSWYINYYDVREIDLGGSMVGTLNGVIGSAAKTDLFTPLLKAGTTAGTGVLAGIGTNIITNNTIDPEIGTNKLGMPNEVFKALSKGVNSAVSAASGNFPGAIIGILSAIAGGSSGGPTPISFNLNTQITLKGNGTSGGAFPSSPTSFWVPGTTIPATAVGYMPLYNKNLGVINFIGKPNVTITGKVIETEYGDPMTDPVYSLYDTDYYFPATIDYSSYLKINPEVLKIARVKIERQDFIVKQLASIYSKTSDYVFTNPTVFTRRNERNSTDGYNYKYGVRFTIRVEPLNGAPSSVILKTFELNPIWNIEYEYYYGH